MGLEAERPTILVIGGSLGARTINNAIGAGLQRYEKSGVQVIWQTGKFYIEECERKVKEAGVTLVKPQAFVSDMAAAYKAADIVISRAGASSISELCLLGKASILVPSPNVAEDHQTKNALALVNKDAALYVKDAEAPALLMPLAIDTVKDDAKLQTLSENILKMALPDSAEIIAKEVVSLAKR
jgi:UDP-N-acetylglucosamine--N-acetylmuramyl-(pentapeptide) pyrophosphoryl-undecaprenol N-acetylglucosamine transferase